MRIFGKDLNNDILIIGEIGINHEGKLKEAIKLIDLAARCGLDAVKFQLYNIEKYQSRDDSKRYDRLNKFNLSDSDYIYLNKRAKKLGLKVLATPLTEDKVKLASSFGQIVKVASGDLNFFPTIDKILQNDKKIILSTGNSTLKEIDKTIKYIKSKKKNISNYLVLLHCVSIYPTSIEKTNIKKITFLRNRYPNITIGYSNHCCEKEAVLSAVALGAKVVEIHITYSKKNKKFRDHELSFDKSDLQELIKSMRLTHKSIIGLIENPDKDQLKQKNNMRKGIVASIDIKKGDMFNKNNIHYARPAKYLQHTEMRELIGKKSKKNFKKGFLIKTS